MRNTLTLIAATFLLTASFAAGEPPAPTAAVALYPSERQWLTPSEARTYDALVSDAKGDPAKIASAVAQARAGVWANLPADTRAAYKKLTGVPAIKVLDLNKLLHDVNHLAPEEIDPKTVGQFNADMAQIAAKYPDPLSEDRVNAEHALVLKYRGAPARTPAKGTGTPRRPTTAAPTTGTSHHVVIPLTPREKGWLTPAEVTAYAAAVKAPATKEHSHHAVYKKYREALATTDLPAEFRDAYKAKLAEGPDAAKIDDFLLTLVELNPTELANLEKILKGKEPAGSDLKLTKDNARLEYEGEMSTLPHESGHVPPAKCHDAYTITAKYRKLAKAAGYTSPADDPARTGPAATTPVSGARLSDADYNSLSAAERSRYDVDFANAKDDKSARDAVNAKYMPLVLQHREFASKNPDEKKKFCETYRSSVVNSDAQAAATDNNCTPERLAEIARKCKTDSKCVEAAKIKECGPQPNATAGTVAPVTTPPPAKADFGPECAVLLNPGGTSPGSITHSGPPALHPGTDKDPTSKEEKKGFLESLSKEQASNVKAAVAGAVFGMLLGSFFGPVGMIAGAAIGGGTFFGANYAANKLQ